MVDVEVRGVPALQYFSQVVWKDVYDDMNAGESPPVTERVSAAVPGLLQFRMWLEGGGWTSWVAWRDVYDGMGTRASRHRRKGQTPIATHCGRAGRPAAPPLFPDSDRPLPRHHHTGPTPTPRPDEESRLMGGTGASPHCWPMSFICPPRSDDCNVSDPPAPAPAPRPQVLPPGRPLN